MHEVIKAGCSVVLLLASGCTAHDTSGGSASSSATSLPPPASTPPAAAAPVPPPSLSDFLPAGARAVDTLSVQLDGEGEREIAITSITSRGGETTRGLLVLTYDALVARWAPVLDAAHLGTGFAATEPRERLVKYVGADMPPTDDEQDTLLPEGIVVSKLSATALASRPGNAEDLLVAAQLQYADGPVTNYGVVRYVDDEARVTYAGSADTVEVVGEPGSARVRLSGQLFTAADAECCPVRDYEAEVGFDPVRQEYRIVRDNRSWIGAVVAFRNGDSGETTSEFVVATEPGTSAGQLLRPGDVLLPDPNGPVSDVGTPSVLHQAAKHQPGERFSIDVLRNQRRIRLAVVAEQRDPARGGALLGRFDPGYFGLSLAEPERASAGVPLADVAAGSPAETAGLQAGDTLMAVAGRAVTSPEQALAALLRQSGSSSMMLTVRSGGSTRRVRITPEPTFPSNHPVVTTLTVL